MATLATNARNGVRKDCIGENRTSQYQQIRAHEALFVKIGKVLNLGHLDFEIVSPVPERRTQGDFEFRI